MKKVSFLAALSVLFLGSCKTAMLSTNVDDVYANPIEERLLARQAAEERAKRAAREKLIQDSTVAAQKAKDDANPYYKEPVYQADDYYDYQYASRINRFNRPLVGAGYYDPFYTNCYTYNQNSFMYGTSIYSTYSYWQPYNQVMFYNGNPYYANGFGMNTCSPFNYGYGAGFNTGLCYSNWNNPGYGWNNGFCNSYGYNNYGYNGFGYNNYYYGGHNGWNNGNWGYFNSQDPNSGYSKMQFGKRGDDEFGNSGRGVSPAGRMRNEDNERQRFVESMANQQNSSPRFENSPRSSGSSSGGAGGSDRRIRRSETPAAVDHSSSDTNRGGNRSNSSRSESSSNSNSSEHVNRRITQQESNDWNNQRNTNSARSSTENSHSGGSGGGSSSPPAPRSSGSGGGRPR